MTKEALEDIYDALQSRVEVGDALALHSVFVELVSECSNLENRITRLEKALANRSQLEN